MERQSILYRDWNRHSHRVDGEGLWAMSCAANRGMDTRNLLKVHFLKNKTYALRLRADVRDYRGFGGGTGTHTRGANGCDCGGDRVGRGNGDY